MHPFEVWFEFHRLDIQLLRSTLLNVGQVVRGPYAACSNNLLEMQVMRVEISLKVLRYFLPRLSYVCKRHHLKHHLHHQMPIAHVSYQGVIPVLHRLQFQ